MRKHFVWFLCLSAVWWSCGVGAAEQCRGCGQSSPNGAYDAQGVYWCSEACWGKALPQCGYCDVKCRNGIWWLSRVPFCSELCLKLNPYPACSLCGAFDRQYWQFDRGGQVFFYCSECVQYPTCFVCELPCIGQMTGNWKAFCAACATTETVRREVAQYGLAQELPQCVACQSPCSGTALLAYEHFYCSESCLEASALYCAFCDEVYLPGAAGTNTADAADYCSAECLAQSRMPLCRRCHKSADERILRENGGVCSWCRREARAEQPRPRRRYTRSRLITTRTRTTFTSCGGATASGQ